MKYMLIHCIEEAAEHGADLDEAIEVASKHPTAWYGTIEVRPIAGNHYGDGAS